MLRLAQSAIYLVGALACLATVSASAEESLKSDHDNVIVAESNVCPARQRGCADGTPTTTVKEENDVSQDQEQTSNVVK